MSTAPPLDAAERDGTTTSVNGITLKQWLDQFELVQKIRELSCERERASRKIEEERDRVKNEYDERIIDIFDTYEVQINCVFDELADLIKLSRLTDTTEWGHIKQIMDSAVLRACKRQRVTESA